MSDNQAYQPLDLTAYRNTPASALAHDEHEAALGFQQFHGLPFNIGEGDTAFIGLGAALSPSRISVPVAKLCYTVVFAHRLVGSRLAQGGPVGAACGQYVFHLANGTQHPVVIRERFEIADVLSAWGNNPFLAVSDERHGLQPRWRGTWSNAGFRQTESMQGWPRHYFLWRWRNPTPDVPLASIALIPGDANVLIAAITLGLIDEDPLSHSGAVPVRIDLKDPELQSRSLDAGPNDVKVEVDRGVAGYAYALSSRSVDEFLADDFAGWGEAANTRSSPLYAEVAAVPSATLEIKTDANTIDSVKWSDVLNDTAVDTERVRIALVEDGRNWVETVVLDEATGQPVPCRVHFRSLDGVPYQPHGHHSHVGSNQDTWHRDVGGDLRLGQLSYAYIDGRCQGWLPRGDVLVDIARGFEYEPLRQRIHIEPGQQRLELRLRRWTNMNAQGWFSGDTHVHFLSTQGSLREARAEDLNVVNLLQSQWGSLFTNTEDFIGEPVTSPDRRTVVWTNQENRQHLLGHMILLGLREPIYPWCSDGPGEAALGSTLDTTLAAWADACHAQNGTVILPHFPSPNGEPAALVATGRVDAVEMIRQEPFNHVEYYRYLNSGYRLPLVGGTDKMSSEVAVGQYRTYVHLANGEEFTYDSWCRNLRLGRTFLSGGPLLELSVNGAEIGDTVRLPAGGGSVDVAATARSVLPIHTLQVIHNGEIVAQTDDLAGTRELSLRASVKVADHSWLCARVGGPDYAPVAHFDTWSRGVFAHTSPIYVAVGEEWSMADRGGLQYLMTLVEGGLAYVRDLAPRRPADRVRHHHAEADHQAFLERPFLEAEAALRARLSFFEGSQEDNSDGA